MARILLVDDDDATRYSAAKLLATAGHEVLEARDYRGALPILEEDSTLELLVVDLMLPQVHGFALARMARMRHREIKCIYITGFDVPTEEAVGPVLRKPLDETQLLASIASALSQA